MAHGSSSFSAAATTMTTSVRFQRLLECIDLALKKSRSSFNVEHAVQVCYGNGDNEVFHSLVESVLDRLHLEVTAELSSFLEQQGYENELLLLEAVISKLDRDAALKKQAELHDKESVELALRNATLPSHMTPHDFVRIQTVQRSLQEKQSLREEIAALEHEIAALEEAHRRTAETMDAGLSQLHTVQCALEATADRCSTLA